MPPNAPSERALFRDLERHVTVAATKGWNVDRLEVEELLEPALDSTCRVDPLARRALATWLEAEIDRRGGPVEAAWRERGKRLRRVNDLLVLSRVQMLLTRAEQAAPDCPFWLEVERPFRGRQTSEGKFQLTFGGGGKGIAVRRGGATDINAGGAGRLLLGRMLRDGHAVYTGLELGGTASFPRDANGMRTSLEIAVDVVAPVVYRRTFTNSYAELETGWLGRSTERDWFAFEHGVHVGFAFGARTLRTQFVFPGAVLGVSWERLFLAGDDVTMLKIGARVALDLDLF